MERTPIWVAQVADQGDYRIHREIEEIAEQLYQQCLSQNYFCDSVTLITTEGTRNTVTTDGMHLWYYQCGGGDRT